MKINIWNMLAAGSLCFVMAGQVALAERGEGPREKREMRGERGERPEGKELREKMKERREGMRERVAKKLFEGVDLSEDQRAQLKAVREKARGDAEAWRDSNKAKFQDIREQMRTARESDDKEAFEAAKKQARDLMKNAPRPSDYTDQVRSVLTDDQREVFDQNREQMKEKFEEWREKRAERWNEMKEKRAEKWKEMKEKREGDKKEVVEVVEEEAE